MRTVLLLMQRRPVAQGLIRKMEGTPGIKLHFESDYANAEAVEETGGAGLILMEIAESGVYGSDYCLALCARLRMRAPGCKLLLLCPEQDKAGVDAVMAAKQNGRVDDFLFYDATIEYLAAKVSSFLTM